MTEPAAEAGLPPPAPPPSRRRFSLAVTLVCTIVVAIYIGLPLGPLLRDASPLDELDRPEDSLDRLVTREMDLEHVMRHGSRFEWTLYRVLAAGEDPTRAATGWYGELADRFGSASAELRRAVLLAEGGDVAGAEAAVATWPSAGEAGRRRASWIRAAYADPPPGSVRDHALLAEIRAELGSGWFADTLIARIAGRIGDERARAGAEAGIEARGRALQWRLRLLMALVGAILGAGALALVVMLARRRSLRVAGAPLPPDWSTANGYALFVRGLGAPQVIILGLFALQRKLPFQDAFLMAADLPVFVWVACYLWRREASLRQTFGLVPDRRGWAGLVGVSLILTALALVGDSLIDATARLAGFAPHWADGLAEPMLWDSRWALVVNATSAAVWAPIVEEVIFRGLLYGTLRTRVGVWPSAVISAVVFALPHGYAATGSLSVAMSGVLWALAYERTRSLLPGLLAHSANNLVSTLWVIGLLR